MNVFVTGGTGYVGTAVVPALLRRGHAVSVLTRAASRARVAEGAIAVDGDALAASSFAAAIPRAATLVHLVGTPHPNPSKADEFERVDLASIRASVDASSLAGIAHLVYVSVAQPAPTMRVYVAVRAAGEATIRQAGLAATFLRPWYVLGPGHRWPLVLVPFYRIAEWVPGSRETARRLGLVTLAQMVSALVDAVEHAPAEGSVRIVDVPQIRAAPPI